MQGRHGRSILIALRTSKRHNLYGRTGRAAVLPLRLLMFSTRKTFICTGRICAQTEYAWSPFGLTQASFATDSCGCPQGDLIRP